MLDDLIVPLIEAEDLLLVGGKAQSLGNLLRNNIKSQDGFVITTANFGNMSKELEQQILENFDKLGAEHVAVRSSATSEDSKEAAWAGQLDTFLNVRRDELIEAVQKIWAGLNSDRARAYAKAKNIKSGKIAVIVQPMLQSEVAGIAFSVHPVTQNQNQIVIEAGLGLGEAVVSGEITPDNYIVGKKSGEILEKHITNQAKKLVQGKSGRNEWRQINYSSQKLTDEKIKELTRMVLKVEELYTFPVDIEWLMKDGVLFIMQARPITNLS
jgi:phosphoenolpyruvate synthase/pyruvate phosphate dikinase